MRLRHIEIFHAVYKHQSISAAARKLNVSQPAISKALRHAEDQIGFSLFTRTGRGLVPTDQAHRLYDEVSKVYQGVARVQRTSRDLKKSIGARLKISTVTGLSYQILPQAIARLRTLRPDTVFDIQTLHYGDLISSLRDFDTDIGLVFEAPNHSGLARKNLGVGEFSCVYKTGQVRSKAKRISPSAIAGLDYISLNANGPLGGKLWDDLQGNEDWPAPVAIAESCFVAKSLVACGVGLSIVDEYTASSPGFPDLTHKRLSPPIEFMVNALYLEARPLSEIGQQFLDIVEAELQTWRKNSP